MGQETLVLATRMMIKKYGIWPLKLVVEKKYDMAIVDINQAVKDMEALDYDEGIVPLPPREKAPSAIYTPPPRPANRSETGQENNRDPEEGSGFIIVTGFADGEVSVTFKDQSAVTELIEEVGIQNIITYMPHQDPKLWNGKTLILRGAIVVPKPKTIYSLEVL